MKSNAVHSERLRSVQLRKHVATLSQVLNKKRNELDMLAQFMGHDINVHRQFYRTPSETMQTAHISKIFMLMESGSIVSQQEKSLPDISVDQTCHRLSLKSFSLLSD